MREGYTDSKFMTEYFVPMSVNGVYQGVVSRRCFYNRNGEIAFEQVFNQKGTIFIYQDKEYSFLEFIGLFWNKLNLSRYDTVLLDRPNHIQVESVFTYVKKARVATFLHSDHLYREKSLPGHPRPSYDYDVFYQYDDKIDDWLVSTHYHKRELENFLTFYGGGRVTVIPVAGLDTVNSAHDLKNNYTIKAASRYEKRKRLDLLIRAVVKAHQRDSRIQLDLYGSGMNLRSRIFSNLLHN